MSKITFAGKPEPLKGDLSGVWSRRINDKDRLVYWFQNDIVIVEQRKGHYDEKLLLSIWRYGSTNKAGRWTESGLFTGLSFFVEQKSALIFGMYML